MMFLTKLLTLLRLRYHFTVKRSIMILLENIDNKQVLRCGQAQNAQDASPSTYALLESISPATQ